MRSPLSVDLHLIENHFAGTQPTHQAALSRHQHRPALRVGVDQCHRRDVDLSVQILANGESHQLPAIILQRFVPDNLMELFGHQIGPHPSRAPSARCAANAHFRNCLPPAPRVRDRRVLGRPVPAEARGTGSSSPDRTPDPLTAGTRLAQSNIDANAGQGDRPMDRDTSESRPAHRNALLRAADQGAVATLVAGCFFAILLHGCWQAAVRQHRIEFDRAPPLELDFQIRLNEADWPEFTLLPGIGETLARRITAYRQQHGPFRTVEQLQDVKGIGPKTLRRIRPYLRVGGGGRREAGGWPVPIAWTVRMDRCLPFCGSSTSRPSILPLRPAACRLQPPASGLRRVS